MLKIPPHLQPDYDALTSAQQQIFNQMAMWGAAGDPMNIIVTDMAFSKIMESVKRMGPEPDLPAEPDKSNVNSGWLKTNK